MPTKNETEKINITISDTMIKEENKNEIKTRVPYTYDDNVRYLVLNQDDVKRIHDGKTLFTSLEKDKIYNLLGESGEVVEQIKGEKLFQEHYDHVARKNKNADKRKSVSEEKTSFSKDNSDKTVSNNNSKQEYNIFMIETHSFRFYYRDDNNRSIQDLLKDYDKFNGVVPEITSGCTLITDAEYAEYQQDENNPPVYSAELNADNDTLHICYGDNYIDLNFNESVTSAVNNQFNIYQQKENVIIDKQPLSNSILANMSNKLDVKIARLKDKNAELQEKINIAKSKIERWQAKKDDAQGAIKHCKKLLDIQALPAPVVQFLKMYAEAKENKIGSLNNKIGNKHKKIDVRQNKVTKNNQKISKLDKKLNKLERIDTFLNNMHSSQGRRENFVDSLQELRKSSLTRSRSKLLKLDKKISETQKAFETTHSAEDKVKLRNTLHTYSEQRKALEEKITKLEVMKQKLEAVNLLSDKRADEIINESCEKVSSAINNNPDITPNQAVDEVLDVSEQTIDNKFAEMKEEPSQNVEDKLKEDIAYETYTMSSEPPQDLPSFQDLQDMFDTPEETQKQEQQQTSDRAEDKENKTSHLSRDMIKRNAAAIKAKEANNEAPKKVKSKGQEL